MHNFGKVFELFQSLETFIKGESRVEQGRNKIIRENNQRRIINRINRICRIYKTN
ncbi:MAG: hypothetical protein LBS50_04120 [Prevotellaceae bacterium]|jgi:hypothetical protein|nr:hypothetical protein [Prevotellaceae bacterium]